MIRENVVAILRKLQYRIQVSREDDPERENAVRLRDRLLEKYGLHLEDIQEARKVYVLDKLTQDAARVAQHVIKRNWTSKRDAGSHTITTNMYRHIKRTNITGVSKSHSPKTNTPNFGPSLLPSSICTDANALNWKQR